jgi:hypothetical protein
MHAHLLYKWFNLGGLGRVLLNSRRIPDPCQLRAIWGACWSALIVLPLILVSPAGCARIISDGCTQIDTIEQHIECIRSCAKKHPSARQACLGSCERRKTFEWIAPPRADRSEDAERQKSIK